MTASMVPRERGFSLRQEMRNGQADQRPCDQQDEADQKANTFHSVYKNCHRFGCHADVNCPFFKCGTTETIVP